jgi:hypothetical protein
MNISEASNIAVAVAVLKIQKENFIGDIGDVIRMNIKHSEPFDLPNLAKSSHYMRSFKYTKDLYSTVHAEAMAKYQRRELDPESINILTQIFTEHDIFTDSPFVKARTQR